MLVRSNDLFPMLFNDVFDNFNNAWSQNLARDPKINIKESDANYTLEFLVPGLNKEDLNLTIDTDNNLVVSMEHKEEQKKEDGDKKEKEQFHYLRHDFHYAHFKETIALPDNIHKEQITAKVENGVLRIVLPKVTAEEKSKLAQTITIE